MDPYSQQWPSVLHPKYLLLQSPPASSLLLAHKQWCHSLHLQPLPPTFSCCSFTSICMYLHTYSHNLLNLRVCGTAPKRQKSGERKDEITSGTRGHSWLAAPRLTSTAQGQPALSQRWPALDHISPHSSQQSRGMSLEWSGLYMASWEKHSQRKCCLRLNPAGSRGGSTPSTGSPAAHLA